MKNMLILVILVIGQSMPVHAKTLTIGLDLSGSNPLVESTDYAGVVARSVREKINAMALGDRVVLRTFGQRGLNNLKTIKVQINRRDRPEKIGRALSRIIHAIPEKQLNIQENTNIVAFLEFTDFGCGQGGEVFLVTDGIESSSYVAGPAFLRGKASLPQPDEDVLKGCAVTMFGIGKNVNGPWPPQQVKNIRKQWTSWMEKAGAEFNPVIDP